MLGAHVVRQPRAKAVAHGGAQHGRQEQEVGELDGGAATGCARIAARAEHGKSHHQCAAQCGAQPETGRGTLPVQKRTDGRSGQGQHPHDHAGMHRFHIPHGHRGKQGETKHHAPGGDGQRNPVVPAGQRRARGQQECGGQGCGHHGPPKGNEVAGHLGRIRRAHGESCHGQGHRKDDDAQQADPQALMDVVCAVGHSVSIHKAVTTSTSAMDRLNHTRRPPVPLGPDSQLRSSEPARA